MFLRKIFPQRQTSSPDLPREQMDAYTQVVRDILSDQDVSPKSQPQKMLLTAAINTGASVRYLHGINLDEWNKTYPEWAENPRSVIERIGIFVLERQLEILDLDEIRGPLDKARQERAYAASLSVIIWGMGPAIEKFRSDLRWYGGVEHQNITATVDFVVAQEVDPKDFKVKTANKYNVPILTIACANDRLNALISAQRDRADQPAEIRFG